MALELEALMDEALALALRGRGDVEPNPRVGALALKDGEVVGRGWHRFYGGPHAEVEALAAARERSARPDTLVVTLEPCSSELGQGGKKTPPCTRALLDAGVRRVVVGGADPDPRHRGRGLEALAAAGAEVVEGVLAARCRDLNRPYLRGLGLDRPWTIAKWAMTLDGKSAAPTGQSRWISGMPARVKVHELRTRVDAVVIGHRTARIDDPELTVRHAHGRQPVRIVVDPLAEIPEASRLVSTAKDVPLWLLVSAAAEPARCAALESLGAAVIRVEPAAGGQRLDLREAWRELRRRGVRRLLVEGGGGLLAQLLAFGCVDQVLCFVAAKIIGGRFAPTPVGGEGKPLMTEAWGFEDLYWQACGEDLAIGAFAP